MGYQCQRSSAKSNLQICYMSKAALAFGYKKVPDLPKYRCTEAPSLTHYGVDMFGPFVILERRSDYKQYCALFTCFACRDVHTGDSNAMDTGYFIQALKRFVARRGTVQSVRPNNGSNFVGHP